ncbi:serine hydrolase domain-containing protein [Roseobacteraceae bacterium S113]
MLTRRILLSTLPCMALPGLLRADTPAPDDLGDGWPVASPEAAGFDGNSLNALARYIDAGRALPNVHALVIERRGSLVFERYWPGSKGWDDGSGADPAPYGVHVAHDLRSISKSVTALVLGIALHAQPAAVDDILSRPVLEFFPEFRDMAPELDDITLHHALTMTAGLAWNETYAPMGPRNDFMRLIRSDDPVNFVLSKPVARSPGGPWHYNSGLTDVVAAIVTRITGEPFEAFALRRFFAPLGIREPQWWRPDAWRAQAFPSASAGLRLTARDVARIGALMVDDGMWQGRQIVPQSWIKRATQRHVPDTPWGPHGAYGYGYYWFPGHMLSGHRVIRAVGFGDQRLFVLPEQGLSVTVFAGNFETGGGDLDDRIMGPILRALRN